MLTKKQLSQAVQTYARKHGFSTSTVRAVTTLRNQAVEAYQAKDEMSSIKRAVSDFAETFDLCVRFKYENGTSVTSAVVTLFDPDTEQTYLTVVQSGPTTWAIAPRFLRPNYQTNYNLFDSVEKAIRFVIRVGII